MTPGFKNCGSLDMGNMGIREFVNQVAASSRVEEGKGLFGLFKYCLSWRLSKDRTANDP
jgi:hypothetical protein